MTPLPIRLTGNDIVECDYLVIGAGSAGCVIASRLSEYPEVKVVLLEAGPNDTNLLLHVPGAISHNVRNRKYNWNYETNPDPGIGGRKLYWSRGRVVGGSSTLNGMVYTRGSKADYDRWSDHYGCSGWAYDDVLPFFIQSENSDRGASRYHGERGPLRVSRGVPTPPFCNAFLEAARECGYRVGVDLNAESQNGFSHYDGTVYRGWRQSASTAYLKAARGRRNLRVVTNAHADSIDIEGYRAIGAYASQNGRRIYIRAKSEVIVSCGALNSPLLLMRSGIGPATRLQELGLRVVAHSPEVGANLQDHVSYKMHYLCPLAVTAYAYLSPARAILSAIRYLAGGKGIIGNLALGTGGFYKSADDLEEPDMQAHLSLGLVPDEASGALPQRDGFTLFVNQGRPYSRGTITLNPADLAMPSIEARYFGDERDMEVLVRGIRRAQAIMNAPALRRYISEELRPGVLCRTDEELASNIRKSAVSTYHYMGTCRMGGDTLSVVDPTLKVRGVDGLRIADASVMPSMINGNLNAPTIMIGEKAANLVKLANSLTSATTYADRARTVRDTVAY